MESSTARTETAKTDPRSDSHASSETEARPAVEYARQALDKPRLRALERALFEFARPTHVVLTTPNAEYNVRYPHLPAGATRHRDHRFEWTRSQFETWARKVAERHGYVVEFSEIGPSDEELGAPTQMAVFHR